MKKPTDFTRLMTSYLCSYLPLQRSVSQNTITSYCDTFRLLLTFLRDEKAMNIERVRIRDFSPELVREYLSWLEHDRGCSISTRSQRLVALRSFFKYVSVETPENMLLCQKVVNIPYAKKEHAAVCYLTTAEMASLLRQPDQSSSIGRRDLCFLSLLYDTGARVSEILALKVRDVHLSNPAKVILYGKGRKLREVPILPNTALHLQQYLTEHKLSAPENLDRTPFVNRQGNPLTRAGATYILDKYVQMAELDTHVSPHILRHTKAMRLLEAGINIFYIKRICLGMRTFPLRRSMPKRVLKPSVVLWKSTL